MFSGQGSQYFHMGKALYAANPSFRNYMQQLNEIVQKISGNSVIDTLYSPLNRPNMPFDVTSLSHPAIVMVEYSLARTMINAGCEPDILIGASLGFFSAAAIAGALSIEDALTATLAHATALKAYARSGAMIAILASPTLYEESFLNRYCELSAVNYDSHFAISAEIANCDLIEMELARRKVVFQRIPVEFAFHSSSVDPAASEFAMQVAHLDYRAPTIPLICCAEASARERIDGTTLWDVTRRQIRFADTIRRTEADAPLLYIDLGPAGTLATFVKYLLPATTASRAMPVLTPFGRDVANWDAALAAVA
jgi:acyl transferase domain-containing protein